jgi:hypothetical protein
LLGLLVYVNYVYAYAELALFHEWIRDAERKALDEHDIHGEARDRYDALVDEHAGTVIRPKRFRYSSKYVLAVRNFFCPLLTKAAIVNAAALLLVGVIAAVMGLVVASRSIGDLPEYPRLFGAIVLMPLAVLVGVVLAFHVLQNIGRFVSLFVASAVLAVFPPLMLFLFQGHLADPQITLTASVISGLIGAGATALSETLKKPRDAVLNQ